MISGGKRSKGIFRRSEQDLPLISVVTVTFNGERYLRQALESILSQSYPNVELIVVDGGSTDGTLDIIRSFEDRIDYWQSEPDKGIYDAMNKGIGLASGSWIGFKNADDWYCDGVFDSLANLIVRHPEVDFWYGNSYSVINENPLHLAPFITDHKSLGGNPGIDHRSCFVRTHLHQKLLFNTKYRLAADFDFFWRLKKSKAVFGHMNSFVSCKRYGGASDGTQILRESFLINVQYAGFLFAIRSRLKGWLGFMMWKCGNFVLRMVLGKEGFLRFKARKIPKPA